MSAAESERAEWLGAAFWERLDLLVERHQRAESEHERARRVLERLCDGEAQELRHAWRRYCEVIAALDDTSAAFSMLRMC